MNIKTFLILACATFLLVCAGPIQAKAGLLEILFPTLRQTGPDPGQTLQAPFAYDPAKPLPTATDKPALPIGDNLVPLDQPHKNPGELGDWLMVSISELMSFKNSAYANEFTKDAHYFSVAGQQQYQEFLTQNNILKTLDTNRYSVISVVPTAPALLNQGVVEGRYRWLFEVSVMVTYLEKGTTTYKSSNPLNQNISIIVQIGRMDKASEDQSVVIERWTGKTKPAAAN